MKRQGFSKEDIYDTLTGAGIPGNEVQLLIDRIEIDFEDASMKSKTSRLGEEVKKIFSSELEKTKTELDSKIRILNESLKSAESGLERLEERIVELQVEIGEKSK